MNASKQLRPQQQLRSRQAVKYQPQQQGAGRRRRQAVTKELKRTASQKPKYITHQGPERQRRKERSQARPQGANAERQPPPPTCQEGHFKSEAVRVCHEQLHARAEHQLATLWRGRAQAQIAAMRLAETRARDLASHGARSLPDAQSQISPTQFTCLTDSMTAAVAAAIAITGPHNLRPVVSSACLPSALLTPSSTSTSDLVPALTGGTMEDELTGGLSPPGSPES